MSAPVTNADATTHGVTRPPVVHVTWQRHAGRAEEISSALGGRALHVHPPALPGRAGTLLRYAASLVLTAAGLARLRPRATIVTNPPVFPAVVVAAYAALTRTPFLLDSHTSSFGVKGNTVARRLLGVHRWLARRSNGVMVTTQSWVREVEGWGARGLVVHEAPPPWTVAPQPPGGGTPRVLFVGVFADDEPVEAVVAAAAQLSDVHVAVTGDLAKCPPGLVAAAGPNVEFVGFLDQSGYRAEVERADVLLALTTEPTSIMRAGYEAVYARRRLVVSDWPALREVFPYAWTTGHDPDALAAALRAALSEPAGAQRLDRALAEQDARWRSQLETLRLAVAPAAPSTPRLTGSSAGSTGAVAS
jgi:glycosyltransferase involved in cell wall biosynthesis